MRTTRRHPLLNLSTVDYTHYDGINVLCRNEVYSFVFLPALQSWLYYKRTTLHSVPSRGVK